MKGLEVKEILRKNRISITEVAEKIGTTNQNLFNILSKDDIKTGLVERISAATGIPLSELYGIAVPSARTAGRTTGT